MYITLAPSPSSLDTFNLMYHYIKSLCLYIIIHIPVILINRFPSAVISNEFLQRSEAPAFKRLKRLRYRDETCNVSQVTRVSESNPILGTNQNVMTEFAMKYNGHRQVEKADLVSLSK